MTKIEFRIFHSNQEDNGKTIARIKPEFMEKFGIKSGDILKISGQQTALVTCMPLYTNHTGSKDIPKITFLNDSGKDNPQIFVSDTVFPNIRLWSGVGSSITVEKTELSANADSDKRMVTMASKVVFATAPWFAKNMGEDYEKRIDFEALQDHIITKKDRVTIPLLLLAEDNNNQRSQRLSSMILDIKPESPDKIWKIGSDTQFEFEDDAPLEEFSEPMIPRSGLHDLIRVIPIVKKVSIDEDIKITIPSLEIYENGSRLGIYTTERLHKIEETMMPDFKTGEEIKMKQPVQRLQGIPSLNIKIHDNLGNLYHVMPGGGGSGGSGTSFPTGESDWEFYSTSEMSVSLMPLIPPEAKEITVMIKEMIWADHMHMRRRLPPTKPPHMTKIEPNQRQLIVASGPWKFDVPITS